MQFIIAFLKRPPFSTVLILILGIALGLVYGWVINPPVFVDATPISLRSDLQEDYLRMAIDSYRLNQDPNLAVQRWKNLGQGAVPAFTKIQQNPGNAEPAVIKAYGELVQNVLSENSTVQPVGAFSTGRSPLVRGVVTGFGILAVVVIVLAGIIFSRRLFAKRGGGAPTPIMQATEISRHTEKTNFEQLGLASPITQTMTTYLLGDDLYDESFSIDTQAGEFLGEYGVGVSEAIGVGDPKKITALEIWLFDKNDIKTATKVLMSEHAYSDAGIRSRLEPKGELILAEPRGQILLETATLQLLATVVDLEYGRGPMPQNSYFERVTLELAVWPKNK
jgi:hypothetical protein